MSLSSWPLKQDLISILKFLMFELFNQKGVKVCEDFFFWVFTRGAQEVKVILGKCKGGGVEI
jgi:hypothetical protein